MKISVVIPTHNKPDRLLLTLYSLCHVNFPIEDFEVILCNDGSNFSLEQIIPKELPFQTRLLDLPHRGRSSARNAGIKVSSGEVIIFNDDDTLLTPDFLKTHWERQQAYDNTIVLGHRKQIYLSEEQIQALTKEKLHAKFSEIVACACDDIYTAQTRPIIFKGQRSQHWICSITSNMSIQAKWLEEHGGFDEGFYRWGFEDLELGYRLSQAGIGFFDDPEIVNYHLEHPRNRKEMIREMEENIQYFYRKYNDAEDICRFWDFFRGKISLQEYDGLTYGEIGEDQKQVYFTLFKRTPLKSLINKKGEVQNENISSS